MPMPASMRRPSLTRREFATLHPSGNLTGMAKAIWDGVVLAESNQTIEIEENQYFPPDAIKKEYFKPSATQSVCPWKGLASYYTVEVNGKSNTDAAWFYPEPKSAAKQIKGYIAFWKGVRVEA